MFGFRFHKESVIFFAGFVCIVGIVAFYGRTYYQQRVKPVNNEPAAIDTSFVTADKFILYDDVVEKRRPDASKVIFIDIRPNALFAVEHIPQSTNVPLEIIDGLNIKDGFTFVVIASAGDEQGFGASAAQALHNKNGNAPIFILRGGFEAWKSGSGQTISFGDPTLITDQSKAIYVTPEDLKKNLTTSKAYFILDLRPKDVYAQGHVPNAVNLPFDQLEGYYEKIPAGTNIVAYGNSGLEDFQAGVRLFDLGFFSTEVLKGGFAAWKSKGFDVGK
jgi:rhodanese-related sulfurtransferase